MGSTMRVVQPLSSEPEDSGDTTLNRETETDSFARLWNLHQENVVQALEPAPSHGEDPKSQPTSNHVRRG